MESQIQCPPCSVACEGRAQKRSNGLCQQLCLGESCTPALAPIPGTSVLPCMPLVSFKMLPQCWSSVGVSLSKSVCRPFKRNCLGIQRFLPLAQSPLVFMPISHGNLSFQYWNPGQGAGLVWGWDPSLPRYYSYILSATHGRGTSPFHVSVSPPLLPV